jgi:hypothetical protein
VGLGIAGPQADGLVITAKGLLKALCFLERDAGVVVRFRMLQTVLFVYPSARLFVTALTLERKYYCAYLRFQQ